MSDETLHPVPEEPAEPAPAAAPPPAPEPSDAPPVAPVPEGAQVAPPPPPPAPQAPVAGQGYAPPPPPPPGYAPTPTPVGSGEKSKVAAGILAILLGALGVHKFYLGYTKEGLILLAVSVISFGMLAWVSSIIGLIEGIIYLTKTDADFYATYVAGRKAWF